MTVVGIVEHADLLVPIVQPIEEVFGINTSLISPQYITEILNGEEVTMATYDIIDWYNKNKEVTMKYLKKYDLLWNQR